MRAVEISKYGPPDVLRVGERPKPKAADGEVVIKVAAAGVSHADVMQRQGSYPPPKGASDIPGLECAGILEEGGTPVCALLTGGGYAEFVAVRRVQVLPVPQGWSMAEAASLPENMFTVYDNLITRAHFQSGQSLLVHGGTSGIGSTAIMLARAFGASFIVATAGTPEKCAAVKAFGADEAIDYKEEDFVERVNALTNGRGVDVIVDIVGGQYIARDLQCIAPDGRIVSLATGGGNEPTIDLRLVLQRRAAIMGSSLRARPPELKAQIAQALLKNVWPLLAKKDPIQPLIDSTFPLEQAAEAHKRMEASSHIGKIVLTT